MTQTTIQHALASSISKKLGVDQSVLKALLEVLAQEANAKVVSAHRTASDVKGERSVKFALTVSKALSPLYGQVQPNVDVLTGAKWIEKGYRIKKGEKAHRFVRKGSGFHYLGQGKKSGLPLFHKSQVEAVAAEG